MKIYEHSQAQRPESNGRVLLVVDHDGLRRMLSMALEDGGFEVIAAATRFELQRRLAHVRPDVVVIDLQRSEVDGLAVLTQLRARHSLSDVPIAFLAGCEDEDLPWRALCAGADWFAWRPLSVLELRTELSALIRTGRPVKPAELSPGRPRRLHALKRTG